SSLNAPLSATRLRLSRRRRPRSWASSIHRLEISSRFSRPCSKRIRGEQVVHAIDIMDSDIYVGISVALRARVRADCSQKSSQTTRFMPLTAPGLPGYLPEPLPPVFAPPGTVALHPPALPT